MRVGIGYDIHRLAVGRKLWLGGVEIPSEAGLEGHSDADVVVHAIMDALLGAAALGDIGHYFPPDDERYRGASSLDLLARVRDIVSAEGYAVENVDVVVVAESPRIAPHVADMRRRISAVLGVSFDGVSVKATTNEGMGPEGRREAISARAVTLLQR